MAIRIDLTGRRFGKWVVEGYCHTSRHRVTYWHVKCDCGNMKSIGRNMLVRGITRSCGCLKKVLARIRATKHGMVGTPTYRAWRNMRERCLRPGNKNWLDYGGRGILICERWASFRNFYADMGEKPKGLTLERINNNGNYEPGNCRYATRREQANNKRDNLLLTLNNKQMTLAQWSEKTGINRSTLRSRIFDSQWEVEKALTTPVNKAKRRDYAKH